MPDDGWVYSLEDEGAVENALYEAKILRDEPRSYREIASDMYTDLLWSAFNFIGNISSENEMDINSEYQKIGTDIVPLDEDAKERLEFALENQELDYEIKA